MIELGEDPIYFSVIVPTYNAENTIRKCLDSILEQSYPFFEIIVINDGSTDQTEKILSEYSSRYNKVKFESQLNLGVSIARNAALNFAKYENILFVDADDYVENNYLEQFVNIDTKFIDFVMGTILDSRIGNIAPTLCNKRLQLQDVIIALDEADIIGYLHNKCFKKSIIEKNGLLFRTDLKICEDLYFVYSYLQYIETIYIIKSGRYIYTDNPGSLSKKILSVSDTVNILMALKNILEKYINKYNNLEKELKILFRNRFLNILFLSMLKSKKIISKKDLDVFFKLFGDCKFLFPLPNNIKMRLKVLLISTPPSFCRLVINSIILLKKVRK